MSRIITFYSYKGGVGRTFALANIGVLLAQKGKKVLLMDWDLEAPGLDRYFFKRETDGPKPECGMIHLLHEAVKNPQADWRKHVISTGVSEAPSLFLLPSGAAHEEYAHDVRSFSWSDFFSAHQGGAILERWREEWLAEYDFVLIDSRTGLTDVSGICTVLLPDFLVLVFSANDQSFPNAVSIALSAQQARKNLDVQRPPLMILPLPSRFDGRDETEDAKNWLERFAETLKPFYDDWLPTKCLRSDIIELTKIPYLTKCSFGEPLTVLDLGTSNPDWPGYYLSNAARLLRTDFADALQIINPLAKPTLTPLQRFKAEIEEASSSGSAIQGILKSAEDEMGQSLDFAGLLDNAAQQLLKFAQFAVAEPLWYRALAIIEKIVGPAHPLAGMVANNLGQLLKATNRLPEAEQFVRRGLEISEKTFGKDSRNTAAALNNLAELLRGTNRLAEAEPLYRRALEIGEKSLGKDNPDVATTLNNLALLLQATKRSAEAEPLYRRALEIDEKSLGKEHPNVAIRLNNLALLLRAAKRSAEAEPLYRRALEIDEKSLGKEHPNVAIRLNNLALLLKTKNRSTEAEPLFRRAFEISERSLGKDHPDVATNLSNLALLLQDTNRVAEAEPLVRRAVKILVRFKLLTGHQHVHFNVSRENYVGLLMDKGWTQEQVDEEIKRIELEVKEEVGGVNKLDEEMGGIVLEVKQKDGL